MAQPYTTVSNDFELYYVRALIIIEKFVIKLDDDYFVHQISTSLVYKAITRWISTPWLWITQSEAYINCLLSYNSLLEIMYLQLIVILFQLWIKFWIF